MKKLLHFLRNLIVLIGWTYVFIYLADILFIMIWNFDFTSSSSWQIVSSYWNSGGTIKTTSDILLFAALGLLPIFWLIGLLRVLKIKYLQWFLCPVRLFYNIFNRSSLPDRIAIRYTKSNEQRAEEIKNELSSLKPSKAESSSNIRSDVKGKISKDL